MMLSQTHCVGVLADGVHVLHDGLQHIERRRWAVRLVDAEQVFGHRGSPRDVGRVIRLFIG
mgnify:CR=1 FL=1